MIEVKAETLIKYKQKYRVLPHHLPPLFTPCLFCALDIMHSMNCLPRTIHDGTKLLFLLLEVCDPSIRFDHGRFINHDYILEGNNITFVCDTGYSPANQQSTITCTQKGWSPAPECILTDIGGKCGRPPPVENGDIVDISKATYFPSETVTYQCQNFYTMEGSPRVTCQNGLWSQTPICRAACTANEEDMRVHNIKLRWSNRNKIYVEDGTTVEFVCLRGYKPHPNTRSLRANCVDGKFDYPDCIPKHYGDRGNT
uniref:Sushi domain-containing protein n=1 Tax=Pseudonaja textilis TaxID=8673 RepID=A0A670ZLE2_PSETE